MTPPLDDDRGQTLHDFAIGMTIFLLVLGYVFAFVPGLFDPFATEVDSTAIEVDRTADYLTEDLLLEGESPGPLGVTCTRYFFNGTDPANCNRLSQPVDEAYIRELVGLSPRTSVNVTMVRTEGPATHQPSGDVLAVGPVAESTHGRIIRAMRVVTFDGRDYRFVVRLW